ncbi:MAG TPA: hypothetical protein PK435_10115 [Thermoanaerobaculaceae bacterium]|nr:hypothetical protein [Thermoanaerobaculaceae bacterium]
MTAATRRGPDKWNAGPAGRLVRRRARLTLKALVMLAALPAAAAGPPTRLWVLRAPDTIVQYDLPTFSPRRTLTVPPRCLQAPQYLSINGVGQMVFLPPAGAEWPGGELATAANRVWIWDGQRPAERELDVTVTASGHADRAATKVETVSRWFLSAGGDGLIHFEATFEKVMDPAGGVLERSERVTGTVSRTDLGGGRPETIAVLPSRGWCDCTTGACVDTCPQWSLWAPDGIVGDFFLMTRFTEGQLETRFHETLLYRRSGSAWRVTKLPRPIERPLTGSRDGGVLVWAIPDAGCCGELNGSSDRTLLLRGGHVSVLYDEWARFRNPNYDVSFYTENARLAPGDATVAYTLVSTAAAGSAFGLSTDAKDDASERVRVQRAADDLPAVEVIGVGARTGSPLTIHGASFVGWITDRELLVVRDGRLIVLDAHGAEIKDTAIRLRCAADAFLR